MGILSVVLNPGNLKTNLLRHMPRFVEWVFSPVLYEAKFGAYTELWAGLSEELTMDDQATYVIPWGRRHPALRGDIQSAMKRRDRGGTGLAMEFREWCDGQVKKYR